MPLRRIELESVEKKLRRVELAPAKLRRVELAEERPQIGTAPSFFDNIPQYASKLPADPLDTTIRTPAELAQFEKEYKPTFVDRATIAAVRATGLPEAFGVKEAGVAKGALVPSPEELKKMPWHKKIPEHTGWAAETIVELAALYGILTKAGFLLKLPKSATSLNKATEMAKWFGATTAIEQGGRRLFGLPSGGAPDVVMSMGIGTAFSLGLSGIGALGKKIFIPSEKKLAWKVLGLNKNAKPPEIQQAIKDFTNKFRQGKVSTKDYKITQELYNKWLNRQSGIIKAKPPKPSTALKKLPLKPVPQTETTIQKLTRLITEAQKPRKALEKEKHKELQKRVAKAAGMLERGRGEEAFAASTAALKGRLLPDIAFESVRGEFAPNEIAGLYDQINDSDKQYFQKLNTSKALAKLLSLEGGVIPTEGELVLLEDMFGPEIVKAVLSKRRLGTRAWEQFLDAVNLPKAFVASFDASASLRQGIMLGTGYPKQWAGAFKIGLKSLLSEKTAKVVDDTIKASPNAGLYEQTRLYIAPRLGTAAKTTSREELFMSRFASKVPFVKMSERAYVTFLNKLRTDVFDHIAGQWQGTDKTTKDYQVLARFINHATGRGTLGSLNKISGGLNAFFFSPRFVASRIEAPLGVFTNSKAARMKIARSLVSFVSTGVAILSLAALAGLDVELDPRSSDFGKIRIGKTRIDFWAGYVQIARFIAQLISAQRKTTTSKEIIDANRLELVENFLRTKLSPTAGLGVDVLAGETLIGKELTLEAESVGEQVWQRLTPIFIQDCVDALKYEGRGSLLIGAPLSFFGVGVQTYEPKKKPYEVSEERKRARLK